MEHNIQNLLEKVAETFVYFYANKNNDIKAKIVFNKIFYYEGFIIILFSYINCNDDSTDNELENKLYMCKISENDFINNNIDIFNDLNVENITDFETLFPSSSFTPISESGVYKNLIIDNKFLPSIEYYQYDSEYNGELDIMMRTYRKIDDDSFASLYVDRSGNSIPNNVGVSTRWEYLRDSIFGIFDYVWTSFYYTGSYDYFDTTKSGEYNPKKLFIVTNGSIDENGNIGDNFKGYSLSVDYEDNYVTSYLFSNEVSPIREFIIGHARYRDLFEIRNSKFFIKENNKYKKLNDVLFQQYLIRNNGVYYPKIINVYLFEEKELNGKNFLVKSMHGEYLLHIENQFIEYYNSIMESKTSGYYYIKYCGPNKSSIGTYFVNELSIEGHENGDVVQVLEDGIYKLYAFFNGEFHHYGTFYDYRDLYLLKYMYSKREKIINDNSYTERRLAPKEIYEEFETSDNIKYAPRYLLKNGITKIDAETDFVNIDGLITLKDILDFNNVETIDTMEGTFNLKDIDTLYAYVIIKPLQYVVEEEKYKNDSNYAERAILPFIFKYKYVSVNEENAFIRHTLCDIDSYGPNNAGSNSLNDIMKIILCNDLNQKMEILFSINDYSELDLYGKCFSTITSEGNSELNAYAVTRTLDLNPIISDENENLYLNKYSVNAFQKGDSFSNFALFNLEQELVLNTSLNYELYDSGNNLIPTKWDDALDKNYYQSKLEGNIVYDSMFNACLENVFLPNKNKNEINYFFSYFDNASKALVMTKENALINDTYGVSYIEDSILYFREENNEFSQHEFKAGNPCLDFIDFKTNNVYRRYSYRCDDLNQTQGMMKKFSINLKPIDNVLLIQRTDTKNPSFITNEQILFYILGNMNLNKKNMSFIILEVDNLDDYIFESEIEHFHEWGERSNGACKIYEFNEYSENSSVVTPLFDNFRARFLIDYAYLTNYGFVFSDNAGIKFDINNFRELTGIKKISEILNINFEFGYNWHPGDGLNLPAAWVPATAAIKIFNTNSENQEDNNNYFFTYFIFKQGKKIGQYTKLEYDNNICYSFNNGDGLKVNFNGSLILLPTIFYLNVRGKRLDNYTTNEFLSHDFVFFNYGSLFSYDDTTGLKFNYEYDNTSKVYLKSFKELNTNTDPNRYISFDFFDKVVKGSSLYERIMYKNKYVSLRENIDSDTYKLEFPSKINFDHPYEYSLDKVQSSSDINDLISVMCYYDDKTNLVCSNMLSIEAYSTLNDSSFDNIKYEPDFLLENWFAYYDYLHTPDFENYDKNIVVGKENESGFVNYGESVYTLPVRYLSENQEFNVELDKKSSDFYKIYDYRMKNYNEISPERYFMVKKVYDTNEESTSDNSDSTMTVLKNNEIIDINLNGYINENSSNFLGINYNINNEIEINNRTIDINDIIGYNICDLIDDKVDFNFIKYKNEINEENITYMIHFNNYIVFLNLIYENNIGTAKPLFILRGNYNSSDSDNNLLSTSNNFVMDKKDNLTIISYVKPIITLNSLNEKVCSFNGYIFTETQLINLIKGYNNLTNNGIIDIENIEDKLNYNFILPKDYDSIPEECLKEYIPSDYYVTDTLGKLYNDENLSIINNVKIYEFIKDKNVYERIFVTLNTGRVLVSNNTININDEGKFSNISDTNETFKIQLKDFYHIEGTVKDIIFNNKVKDYIFINSSNGKIYIFENLFKEFYQNEFRNDEFIEKSIYYQYNFDNILIKDDENNNTYKSTKLPENITLNSVCDDILINNSFIITLNKEYNNDDKLVSSIKLWSLVNIPSLEFSSNFEYEDDNGKEKFIYDERKVNNENYMRIETFNNLYSENQNCERYYRFSPENTVENRYMGRKMIALNMRVNINFPTDLSDDRYFILTMKLKQKIGENYQDVPCFISNSDENFNNKIIIFDDSKCYKNIYFLLNPRDLINNDSLKLPYYIEYSILDSINNEITSVSYITPEELPPKSISNSFYIINDNIVNRGPNTTITNAKEMLYRRVCVLSSRVFNVFIPPINSQLFNDAGINEKKRFLDFVDVFESIQDLTENSLLTIDQLNNTLIYEDRFNYEDETTYKYNGFIEYRLIYSNIEKVDSDSIIKPRGNYLGELNNGLMLQQNVDSTAFEQYLEDNYRIKLSTDKFINYNRNMSIESSLSINNPDIYESMGYGVNKLEYEFDSEGNVIGNSQQLIIENQFEPFVQHYYDDTVVLNKERMIDGTISNIYANDYGMIDLSSDLLIGNTLTKDFNIEGNIYINGLKMFNDRYYSKNNLNHSLSMYVAVPNLANYVTNTSLSKLLKNAKDSTKELNLVDSYTTIETNIRRVPLIESEKIIAKIKLDMNNSSNKNIDQLVSSDGLEVIYQNISTLNITSSQTTIQFRINEKMLLKENIQDYFSPSELSIYYVDDISLERNNEDKKFARRLNPRFYSISYDTTNNHSLIVTINNGYFYNNIGNSFFNGKYLYITTNGLKNHNLLFHYISEDIEIIPLENVVDNKVGQIFQLMSSDNIVKSEDIEVIINGYTLYPNIDYQIINTEDTNNPNYIIFRNKIPSNKNISMEINILPNSKVKTFHSYYQAYKRVNFANPDLLGAEDWHKVPVSRIIKMDNDEYLFFKNSFSLFINNRKIPNDKIKIIDTRTICIDDVLDKRMTYYFNENSEQISPEESNENTKKFENEYFNIMVRFEYDRNSVIEEILTDYKYNGYSMNEYDEGNLVEGFHYNFDYLNDDELFVKRTLDTDIYNPFDWICGITNTNVNNTSLLNSYFNNIVYDCNKNTLNFDTPIDCNTILSADYISSDIIIDCNKKFNY